MNESELCRPTKPSKNTKLCASQSARSSLAPAGLRGARGAEPLASGKQKAKRQTKLVGRTKQKTERGQDPRPKQDKKAVKRHRFSGKQRRGQAPALHVGSADPKAGNSQKKRVLNSREQHSPCAYNELPATSSRTATASSAVGHRSPA